MSEFHDTALGYLDDPHPEDKEMTKLETRLKEIEERQDRANHQECTITEDQSILMWRDIPILLKMLRRAVEAANECRFKYINPGAHEQYERGYITCAAHILEALQEIGEME